jgi:hypothetical protein
MTATPAAEIHPVPLAHPNPPLVQLPEPPPVDNRPVYLSWGLAWLAGHGAFALSSGDNPLVGMPGWLPAVILGAGLSTAMVVTGGVTARASKGLTGAARTAGTLIGAAWAIGFTALALFIVGAAGQLGDQHLQTIAWPTGSSLVIGLLYIAGGVATRDIHQYALGTYLALVGTGAVFLADTGMYAALATAGAGGYLVAAALEPRRLTAARS